MKRLILLAGLLVCTFLLYAQTVPYQVAIDLTSSDTSMHQSVIRWANSIVSANPNAQVEVVLYGQSLDMVTKGKSSVTDALQQALAKKNVAVVVCENAMRRHNLDKSQLLPGVSTVPDGIYELVIKQKEGWGYIKATH